MKLGLTPLWRIAGTGNTEHTNIHFSDQIFTLEGNGTFTVQKFGHIVTRTTNDIYTTIH